MIEPPPLPPTPAPAHDANSMAQDISDAEDVRSFDLPDSDLPPLPTDDDDEDSFLQAHDFGDGPAPGDESVMMDREMKRQLMDIESSFLPEASVQVEAAPGPQGADDTYLFGGSPGHTQSIANAEGEEKNKTDREEDTEEAQGVDSSFLSDGPPTPADAYKTPAARRLDVDTDDSIVTGDSASEAMPSSPSAEAAQRTRRRDPSATNQLPDEAHSSDNAEIRTGAFAEQNDLDDSRRPTSSASTVKAPEFGPLEENSSFTDDHDLSMESLGISLPSAPTTATRIGQRPSFLQHRQSSQRSSVSSLTNHSDLSLDGGSNGSASADFALSTGGAVPRSSDQRNSMLSRLPSLGSIASSVSGYSESNTWDKTRSVSANSLSGLLHPDNGLERLEEETHSSTTPPETPRAPSVRLIPPTDTVIARHVQDIQVPDTVAREFREKHGRSPEKRHMATPFTRNKHNLTLKEQNSKIDKLSKENFDLKLKIHFLDQALQNRSDENVKETISKNVQLQTDLANEKKDNLTLRKKIRDLERRMKAQEDGEATISPSNESDGDKSDGSLKHAAMEEEIEFLRERLVSTETHVEHWKSEAMTRSAENRRYQDYIKNTREKGSSEDSAGVDEAIHIMTEDLEEERTRREQAEARFEQADAEREQLRDELQRMREQNQQGQQHSLTNNHMKHVFNSRKIYTTHTTRSNSGSDVNEQPPTISIDGTSGTYVEHLQTDNEKLQRDLHAQASMLTSRNRENLRLREENEGLKLTIRRGDAASIAGDSILERSISRNHMRSVSRASHATRMSQVSDPERDREREDMERKLSALRDELSQAKLQYKELDDQLNGHLDLLEQTENKTLALQQEYDTQNEDLQRLSTERDEILEELQEKDQECEDIRQQALETIQRLESEIELKEQECNRLLQDIENVTEDFNALQQEMKNVSESLLQLEDDRDASLRKIQNLEAELEDANQELGRQDKLLSEEKSKNERTEIQLESCQGEVDFLREEQEGDKIKIGELELALNGAHVAIQEEKERFRDLEERVSEERHQRDALDTQEKQEVDRVMTDLNTQLAKLKEDNRKLRKSLSGKEVEATQWKQRLDELETNLREALGDLKGTRTSMLKVPAIITAPTTYIFNAIVQDVHKLQRDLEATMQELDNTKQDLAEKDRLLRNRDSLLENTGLENRRLQDMLERERQARRQDQTAFENAKRGHQSVTRTIQQHESRVLELETLRSQDRQKLHGLEKQYKDQLLERNNLLYALWNRLSTLCGAEWARSNSLVSGELTSMELISKNIQGFNKNIILAVKNVEQIIGGFRQRIRSLEKDLTRDYQTLEHTLDVRIKRLDQLEKLVRAQRDSIGRPSTIRGGVVELNNQEVMKLRTENKTLRTEVTTLRAITATTNVVQDTSRSPSRAGSPGSSKRASMAQTLLRHHSSSAVEGLSNSPDHPYPQAGPVHHNEQKWIHRLKELEKRLKQEREARLLDRSGARKRLEQKQEENVELKAALDRERDRKEAEGSIAGRSGGRSGSGSRSGSQGPHDAAY
jgi:chromosome segregation ATPase